VSFFTRLGDEGFTGILGEGKLPKFDLRLETLGTIDEANSALGMARGLSKVPGLADLILRLQRDLYKMMAEAAATPETAERFHFIDERHIAWLEQQIELFGEDLKVPEEFIVPGDTQAGAAMDLARTVVRRAERRAAELLQRGDIGNINILKYLNRLSSLLYILELKEIQEAGNPDLTRAKTERDDRDFT
jgi:cob(I)alamin adenosyltransferase